MPIVLGKKYDVLIEKINNKVQQGFRNTCLKELYKDFFIFIEFEW